MSTPTAPLPAAAVAALGPAAWAAHLLVGYALVPSLCRGSTASVVGINVATVVAAALALVPVVAARAALGRLLGRMHDDATGAVLGQAAVPFVRITGAALGVLFSWMILLSGLAFVVTGACR